MESKQAPSDDARDDTRIYFESGFSKPGTDPGVKTTRLSDGSLRRSEAGANFVPAVDDLYTIAEMLDAGNDRVFVYFAYADNGGEAHELLHTITRINLPTVIRAAFKAAAQEV